jgi:uncharacterized protein YjdB
MKSKYLLIALFSVFIVNSGCAKSDVPQNIIATDSAQVDKNQDRLSTITPSSATIKIGKPFKFNAKIELIDGSLAVPKRITWTCANPYAAEVESDGTVTGLNEGFAIITAASKDDPTRKARATINVVK